jgi:hypothetical protein
MDQMRVHLIVSFTFASNGSYLIPLANEKNANITIAHATSGIAATGIIGTTSHGNIQLLPDDPNGFMNISNISIELPFLIESSEPGLSFSMMSNMDTRPDIQEIKKHCLECLNRLIDVVRYNTKRYWMRTLREQDLFIYKITREKNGREEDELFFSPPSGYNYPVQIIDEDSVKPSILEMLQKRTPLPLYLKLWLDGLSLYSSGRFNEAVINANISFEVFLDEYLSEKYKAAGKSDEEIEQLLAKDFKDGMHKLMRRQFFAGQSHEDLTNTGDPIYLKFDNFRKKRTNAIHHRMRNITMPEALQVLRESNDVVIWVMDRR